MEPLLPLSIELSGRASRLRELHRQLRSAIIDGRLRPGLRLPSTRALARLCGVGRNTAVAAYDLLHSEGYILSKRGSGTRVSATLPRSLRRSSAARRQLPDHRLAAPWRGQSCPQWTLDSARFSFSIGVPDLKRFPVGAWRRASNKVLRSVRAPTTAKWESQGRTALRESIAHYVSVARAVACDPDDIVVTAGAQQAFGLLASVLVTSARTVVAMEDPGYSPIRAAFAARGANIAAVPVDKEGLLTDRLPRNTRVICATPSHQFPLGCVMSAERRARLIEFAQARRAVVIEDDYDGDFRFTDRPLDALQTLDQSESVFYVGTFSKSLTPALRLGYIVAPPWARSALVAAKTMSDGGCCTLTQDTLDALIRDGHLARHVRHMQDEYQQRRRILLEVLHRDFVRWLDPVTSAAGLHIAALIKPSFEEGCLMAEASKASVGLTALSKFAIRSGCRGAMFGYGNIEIPDIVEGLARLRKAWSSCSSGKDRLKFRSI
jgi:GntR family transcriptional regulator / MocR family aminotransferase